MKKRAAILASIVAMAALGGAVATGCRKETPEPPPKPPPEDSAVIDRSVEFGPDTSPVAVDMSWGWCGGHGVPESVCTRCDDTLIAKFKAAGDWCAGHGLPETQCTLCNPEVSERWAALRPQPDNGAPREPESDTQLERVPRLVSGTNDALCPVDTLRVRFVDADIARKAGIETEPVMRRRMSSVIEVPAEVEFDATRVTRVTPRLAGVVLEAAVGVGDHVEAGDLLARIDCPMLGEAKSRYIERQQNLRMAEADLQRVRTIHQGVIRMLEVCTPEADALAIRQALAAVPVGDAKAKLLRAHASLQLARAEVARESQLVEKKVSSARSYETALSALAAAEADFTASREEIAFSNERDRLAADRALQVARGALGAAVRTLRILGLSAEQVADVGHESDESLSRHELRSPVSGRVVRREVAAGESVNEADVLFVIVDNSMMWLVADVYERDLLRLREGQPVIFTVDGLAGVSFQGTVSWISSQMDDRTRTVRARADLSNEDGLLRAMMFGRARIVVHDNDEVISVPADAVQTDGCCQLVFVRQSDTAYQPRKVLLGTSASGFVEVLKGLDEGEVVATTGSFLMKTEILKSNIGAGCCDVDPGR